MRRMLAMGIVATLTNIGAANAEWVKAAPDNDPASYYVDTGSIKATESLISASILTNSIFYPSLKNASAVVHIFVNCHSGTVHNKRTTIYSQPMGRGDPVETMETNQTITVGAHSGTYSDREEKNLEAIFNFICRPVAPPDRERAIQLGPIPFAAGTSNLGKDAKAGLDKVVAWLKANPDQKLRLEGHSDDPGTDEYNLAIGEKRANSVRAYLVAGGVDASRLTIVSRGRSRPRGGQNSRVEMVVGE